MSFGYFQGQEAQALAYYKKLLESESDPKVRKELEELTQKLQRIVDEKKQSPIAPTDSIQHAVACFP